MPHPKQLLNQYGLTAKKSLGQNFLYDERLLAKIARTAELARTDRVVEIGAGLGGLTRQIAYRAERVLAVELDARLLPILHDQLSEFDNVSIIHDDILKWRPEPYFTDSSYKVVGNVPYYITGAILRHILTLELRPATLVLTVQQEVADRMAAQPGNMSLLSVTVQFYCDVRVAFLIGAGAFWPRPEVGSAVVKLNSRPSRLVALEDEQRFFTLVRAGFSQKRKQLQKSLRSLGYSGEHLRTTLTKAGIEARQRAESLSLEDWVAVHNLLSGNISPSN